MDDVWCLPILEVARMLDATPEWYTAMGRAVTRADEAGHTLVEPGTGELLLSHLLSTGPSLPHMSRSACFTLLKHSICDFMNHSIPEGRVGAQEAVEGVLQLLAMA